MYLYDIVSIFSARGAAGLHFKSASVSPPPSHYPSLDVRLRIWYLPLEYKQPNECEYLTNFYIYLNQIVHIPTHKYIRASHQTTYIICNSARLNCLWQPNQNPLTREEGKFEERFVRRNFRLWKICIRIEMKLDWKGSRVNSTVSSRARWNTNRTIFGGNTLRLCGDSEKAYYNL